jgi:hypothetical protein
MWGWQEELTSTKSPDGQCVATLFHKERDFLPLPGPEPPPILKRWARLKVAVEHKTIYDSGYENLNIYQYTPGFALDLLWSPNSANLAYRHISSLRVVGRGGKIINLENEPEDYLISSFKWIDDANLLVVSKKTKYGLGMDSKPNNYPGYKENAKNIRIMRWNIEKGATEQYQQNLSNPTFLFHAVNFHMDEISPNAGRVAFSDGSNLCIYDDAARKVIVKVGIPQKPPLKSSLVAHYSPATPDSVKEATLEPAQLEGVWWQTNDKLVVGVGLLGFSFYTYDIPSNSLIDVTSILLPKWDGGYMDADWYKAAIK